MIKYNYFLLFIIINILYPLSTNSQTSQDNSLIKKLSININKERVYSQEDVLKFIKTNYNLPSFNWEIIQETNDNLGFRHIKYRQTFNQTPVYGGELLLHFNADSVLYKINGQIVLIKEINNRIKLSKSKAKKIVLNTYKSENYYKETSPNETEKWIYFNSKTDPIYIYKVDVYSTKPLFRYTIFIDCETGKEVDRRNRILHNDIQGNGSTMHHGVQNFTTQKTSDYSYILKNSIGGGIHTVNMKSSSLYEYEFTDIDNEWFSIIYQDPASRDVHWGSEQVYKYYSTIHNFNSFDNLNSEIKSRVHFAQNYDNAFWDGEQMTYGDGDGIKTTPFTSIDIIGHEITHGITQHTANLEYLNESGALNESFSDILACAIRFYADSLNANFLIGDLISKTGTPLRSLESPSTLFFPEFYQGSYWQTGLLDNGGVHKNSSVQNYWFYILVNGKTNLNELGNSYNIEGIGIEKVSKIAFRNLTTYLTAYSDFQDAREGSIQAAIDLFGDCSSEVIQTTNAWNAVGVGDLFQDSPVACLSIDQAFACELPHIVNFNNLSSNSTTFSWNFGDGSTSTLNNPSHSYTTAGNYTVTLIANSTESCSNLSDTIILEQIINVSTNITPSIPALCNSTFSDSADLHNIDIFKLGQIHHYINDFNGNNGDFTCEYFTNLNEGQFYNLSLYNNLSHKRVWIDYNNDGIFQDEEIIHSSELNLSPVENILISHDSIQYNTPLRMRIVSTGDTILPTSCTTFTTGQQLEYSVKILPNTNPPSSQFTTELHQTNPINHPINFLDLSTGVPTTWHWIFENGTPLTSNSQHPTNINYSAIGDYNVTLITTNAFGTDTTTYLDYIHIVNEYNMCASSFSNEPHGILYDSGGPDSTYQANEDCSFLIDPGCLDLTITFSYTNLDHLDDQIYIYEGSDNTGIIIDSFSTDILPSPITIHGKPCYIEFNSNNSFNNNNGWELHWTTSHPNLSPIANFIIPDTISFNQPITIYDISANSTQMWQWDFGDGSTSIDQHPTKTFVDTGYHEVKLVVDNCYSLDSLTKAVYIGRPGGLSVSSDTIYTNLDCGITKTISYTIYNVGEGNLVLNAQSNTPQIHIPELLMFTFGTDFSDELLNLQNLLTDSFPLANTTDYIESDLPNFSNILMDKDILIIPELEEFPYGPSYLFNFHLAIHNYLQDGGHVIFCGNWKSHLNGFSFLPSIENQYNIYTPIILDIVDSSHIWFDGVNFPLQSERTLITQHFTNPDYVSVANFGGLSALGYLPYGDGQIDYFGYDFEDENTNTNMKTTFVNLLQRTLNGSHLSIDTNAVIYPGDSLEIYVDIDGYGLLEGVYLDSIIITSNDYPQSNYPLYVEFTIEDNLEMELSTNLIEFDTVFQGTYHYDTIEIYNRGCLPLIIDSIRTTNPVFSVTPNNFTIDPFTPKNVILEFFSPNIDEFIDTITFYNNDSIQTIIVNGASKGSPIINIIPDSTSVSIMSCGDSITFPITIINDGLGLLNGRIHGLSFNNDTLQSRFFDSFENNNYDNWVTNGIDVDISNTAYSHGDYSLELTGISSSITRFIEESNPTYFSIHLKQNYYYAQTSKIYLGNNSDIKGVCSIWKEGNSLNFNSSFYSYTISDHSQWIDIELKNINYSTHTFDVYINQNLVLSNIPFHNSATDNVTITRIIKVTSHPLLKCYFDEVQIGHQSIDHLTNLNNDSINILPGDTQIYEMTLLSEGLQAGHYTFFLDFSAILPLQQDYKHPIDLTLFGKSQISSNIECIDFDTMFQDAITISDTLWIQNYGCDTLKVSNIEYSSIIYTGNSTEFIIPPFDAFPFLVTINDDTIGTNNDSLQFISHQNDTLSVCLKSVVIGAPNIILNLPNPSYSISSCQFDSIVFPYTVYNTGLNNLEIINGLKPLESILEILNSNSISILNEIPSYFDFEGGYTGNSIYDGGEDMFDAGNFINTNYQDSIPYTNNTIQDSPTAFGPNGKYFTAKYDGLFVMSADIDSISQFSISGYLGANGLGDMVGNDLTVSYGGREYIGFYKKVFNSTDPSVNHLIIIENESLLTHHLPFTTSFDSDIINGLQNSNRIYYILFGGTDSFNYPDSIFKNVMTEFISLTNHENFISETIQPGDSVNLEHILYPNNLQNGSHNINVPIFNNDPNDNPVQLSLNLFISTPPCIENIRDSIIGCGGSVNFDLEYSNSATSYLWNFGDGNSDTIKNPSHNFSSSGIYTISATTCNSIGCDTFTYDLEISNTSGPIASNCTPHSQYDYLHYGITNIEIGTYSNTSVATEEGYQNFVCQDSILLFSGNTYVLEITTATQATAMYTKAWIDYNNNGSFEASEMIMEAQNAVSPFNGMFSPSGANVVLNTPLRMRVVTDRYNAIPSNNPCVVSYGEFEDYSVIISNEEFQPESHFFLYEIDKCNGEIQFNDLSSNSPTSWDWDFGNGSSSTIQNPINIYDSAAVYTITLIASNSKGSDTTYQQLQIKIADIEIVVGPITGISTPIQFSTISSNYLSYDWSFDNGTTSIDSNPSTIFQNPQSYSVILEIENIHGCTASDTVIVDLSQYIGLEEMNKSVSIFPNPAKDDLYIINTSNQKIVEIKIINTIGQLILKETTSIQKTKKQLDISKIPIGLYTIQYKFEDNSEGTHKLIVK